MNPIVKEALQRSPFFQNMKEEHLQKIGAIANEVKRRTGTFLLREGEEANALYLIVSGRVTLEMYIAGRGATQVESLGPGDIVGLSWFFPPHHWTLDARVTELLTALSFDSEVLRAQMEEDHHFGYAISKPLLDQLYSRLQKVRFQRLDIYQAKGAR
jgi:CRP/FNR family cyclic AMP-dependent transcriptional regulator